MSVMILIFIFTSLYLGQSKISWHNQACLLFQLTTRSSVAVLTGFDLSSWKKSFIPSRFLDQKSEFLGSFFNPKHHEDTTL